MQGNSQIIQTLNKVLTSELTYERDVQRPLLVEAITQCEAAQDYVSRDLLEELLEASEEAIDWLETQQALIAAVTLPNYLQQHMGDNDN